MYNPKILIFFLINILLTIISSFLPIISSAFVDPRYEDCAPSKPFCGLEQGISYPFWESNIVSAYCGHPSFKLTCEGNSSLTINIENQSYKIIDINYSAKVFTIAKSQFLAGPCASSKSLLTNTTLDLNIFNISSESQNATLFYDCNVEQLSTDQSYAFPCSMGSYSSSGSTPFNHTVGYMAINETSDGVLRKNCSFEINVPVLRTLADDLASGKANIPNVLSAGFKVNWLIDADGECEDCSKSGGRCGYNLTLGRPTCFCQDAPYDRVCGIPSNETSYSSIDAAPKIYSRRIIGLAVGIGIVICLLVSTVCIFLCWRNHKDSSTDFLTRKKSYSQSKGGTIFPMLNGSTYFGVQVFNYRELEEATEYFNPSKELGEGGFGTVYHGKLRDGREVAIKRLYQNNSKQAEQFLNEVEILANLQHENLVNLYGCTARQGRELLLVYEYVPNGTVADHLHGKLSKLEPLPWSTRLSIATETASALVYLHESDIVHRDVKTQNILLGDDFSVKVADFGLSRLFPLDVTHVSTAPQGTPGYVDPEYHLCYQLTEKSDVYSFGVMLAELISSLPAVDITRKRNEVNLSNMAINKIQDGALHEFVDPSLGYESDIAVTREITAVAKLAFQCLQSTKEIRPSMKEVFEILYVIQNQQASDVDSAEVLDIPADDVFMLKGDFSPTSPQREDYLGNRYYKPNASV